jgi:hypothetical protein
MPRLPARLSAPFIVILALCSSACDLFLEPGSVRLSFNASARAIVPAASDAPVIKRYSVSLSNAGKTVELPMVSETTCTVSGLRPGTWSISVKGYGSAGLCIAEAALEARVEAGKETAASASLERLAGTGTLSLKLSWTDAGTFDELDGRLTDAVGGDLVLSLAMQADGRSAAYNGQIPAGEYTLNLALRKNGTVIDSLSDSVSIYANCTSSATFDRTPQTPPITYTYSSTSPMLSLAFAPGVTRQIVNLGGVAGKSLYLVKVNTGGQEIGAAASGRADLSREYLADGSALPATIATAPVASTSRRLDSPAVAAWNAGPAARLRPSAARKNLFRLPAPTATVAYGANPALTVGVSTRKFWVQDASGAFVQATATLRALGQYCYVWVANANFDDGSGSKTDNRITSSQAQELAERFDGHSGDSWKDGIYRLVSNVFGNEPGGGSGDGGRDGDRHVSILAYDIDGDHAASQTGGVFGYFWSKDDYTQQFLDSQGYSSIKSNEAELFYLDSHFTDRYPMAMYSTLAHEFQHMIHYNQKSYVHPTASPDPVPDTTWLDEMCSMVAEDLIADRLGTPDADAPWSRLHEFCYHYAESGVTDWLDGKDTLKSYASAYAFGAWLLRNYGGPALFGALVQSNKVDQAAITAALQATGYPAESFGTVLAAYGQSLVYTEVPASSAIKPLKRPGAWTLGADSTIYRVKALDYAAIRQLDLATGYLDAYGPRVYSPDDMVALRPAGLALVSKASWQDIASDTVTVLVQAPTEPSVRFFLMVK